MTSQDSLEAIAQILVDSRALLALPKNDFSWSTWDDANEAFCEIDPLIKKLRSDEKPPRLALEVLFMVTGPIQEASLSSGWGREFLALAARFDDALARAYD